MSRRITDVRWFSAGVLAIVGLTSFSACRSGPRQTKVEEPAVQATEATEPASAAPATPAPAAPSSSSAAGKQAPAGGWVRLPPLASAPLSASVLAFVDAAKKAQEDPSAERWLREALGEAKVTRLGAPVPASVQRAAAALRRWAASGEAVSFSGRGGGTSDLLDAFEVALALIFTVDRSDAPMAATLLRFGQALRAPGNTTSVIAFGSNLAAELAAHVLELRHQPVTEPFRTYALTEQDALNVGRSSCADAVELARLVTLEELRRGTLKHSADPIRRDGTEKDRVAAQVRELSSTASVAGIREANGLTLTGDWQADEFAHYQAFWDETEHLVATAKTAAEMASVMESRHRLALIHPTSMLVRLVGDLALSNQEWVLVSNLAERARTYQAMLAAVK